MKNMHLFLIIITLFSCNLRHSTNNSIDQIVLYELPCWGTYSKWVNEEYILNDKQVKKRIITGKRTCKELQETVYSELRISEVDKIDARVLIEFYSNGTRIFHVLLNKWGDMQLGDRIYQKNTKLTTKLCQEYKTACTFCQ